MQSHLRFLTNQTFMAKPKNKASENDRIAEQLVTLIAADLSKNIDSIISNARTNNSARFSISCKVNDLNAVPEVFATIAWAKHYKAKSEAILEDPNQSALALGDAA